MKIEKIRFDNINSLGGHFELELTHSSLTDTGIFVITGPTGSGKTTLLDAITYAIYGQTERQGKLTGSRNEIMTHGADFCRAEAIVRTEAGRYLFTTEQRRRKTRVAGNDPFSTAERSVSRLDADGKATLISKAKGAVDKFAAGLMKYENFCRCMMLAQGEFARFLKAEANERSETLATITGTEIYQRIGDKVQARVAGLKAALAGVALLPVMEAETRLATEQQRDAQEKNVRETQSALDQLNKALAWHAELGKAAATRQACTLRVEQASAALQHFESSGQRARLQSAEAAHNIRPQDIARRNAAQQLSETRQQHDAEQAWLADHPDNALRAAAEQAATALEQQQPALEAQLHFLAHTVQPLENAISQAAVKARAAAREAEKRRQEAEEAARSAEHEQQKSARAESCATRAAEALAQLAADAALVETLPAIHQRLKDWQQCPQTEEELPPAAELSTRVAAEAEERARILGARKREELPRRLDQLTAFSRLLTKRAEALEHAQKLAYDTADANRARAALPSVEEAESAYKTAQNRAQLAYKIQDVSGKLDELYREFCDGRLTHCPCCGSPEPHERPPHAADALAAARRAEKEAQQELRARQKANDAAQEAYNAARAAERAFSKTLERLGEEYLNFLRELGWEGQEPPADLAAQIETLQGNIHRLRELDALATDLLALQRQDSCRRALHEALRPCSATLPAQLAEAAALIRQLSERQKRYSQAAQQQEAATHALNLARQSAAHAQSTAENAARKLAAATAAQEQGQQELAQLQQQLAAIWQGATARKAEEGLRATLRALQQAKQQSHEQLQKLTLQRESHAARAKAAGEQLPALQNKLTSCETAFSAALAEHGFADAEAYSAALLPAEEREQLRLQENSLRQQLAGAEGACKQALEQENALRALKLSEESAEVLAEKENALSTLLAEQNEWLKQLYAELLKDDSARRDNAEKEAQMADTRRELEQWQRLFDILGGTKDGFKKYAQRITFNLLLVQANKRLRLLTERYTLVQDDQEVLKLRVIDRYRNEERSCSNLSGGESFIVSLALALGLAQMAGETRIDTLFLDEGFGTLDEDALEQVLSCLQSLRAGGKLIGIISHVDALKERIPATLELLPRGTTGLSTIAEHAAVIARPM